VGFVPAWTKTHRLKPVLLKSALNRSLKWGERPVEGSGRSWGMGKFKKDVVEPELSGPGFAYGTDQTQEDQNSEYRDAGYDNHRRPRPSVAGSTRLRQSALARRRLEARDCSEQLQPRDHSARKPRPRKWAKGYIRVGTLVRLFQPYTPRSGIFSRASLKRLVKFAMQMARVSSTICPSS